MITQVTEKETQLSHMLSVCSEALKSMTAERDDALYAGRLIVKRCDKLVQERDSNARLFLEDIKTVEAERDALKAGLALWQNPNRSVIREMAALVKENKTLRDALATAVKLNSFREFNDHIPVMKSALGETK